MEPIHRRDFVKHLGQAGVAAVAAPSLVSAVSAVAAGAPQQTETFCAFTESFQDWPIPKVCEKFREIGLDGLDLTVRPGGHIEPAQAAAKLPGAAQAAKDNGVRISMLSTAIVEPDSTAEAILSTCAELGIPKVKLGYQSYSKFGKLLQQLDDVRHSIDRVAKLAAKYKVLPCVHIHSGNKIPNGGAIAYLLMRDFSPTEVGMYVDPMHMTVEGGGDGWRQGLDLLAPWIAISSLKNCAWTKTGRDGRGQERWRFVKCPLADGIAQMPEYLATLSELGYHGLFTLHSEYKDKGSWKSLTTDECLQQTKEDFEYAKGLLKA